MNIASLPSFSISIPKKMKQQHFEGSILNRLSEDDRNFFSSFYDFEEGRYVRRYSSESEKIKKMEEKIGDVDFNEYNFTCSASCGERN